MQQTSTGRESAPCAAEGAVGSNKPSAVSAAGTRAEAKGSLEPHRLLGAQEDTTGQSQGEDRMVWAQSLTVVTGAPSGRRGGAILRTSSTLCLSLPIPAHTCPRSGTRIVLIHDLALSLLIYCSRTPNFCFFISVAVIFCRKRDINKYNPS